MRFVDIEFVEKIELEKKQSVTIIYIQIVDFEEFVEICRI